MMLSLKIVSDQPQNTQDSEELFVDYKTKLKLELLDLGLIGSMDAEFMKIQ